MLAPTATPPLPAALTGKQRLICQLTLRDGKIAWDRNSRAADDYRKLGPAYGVRDVDRVVRPPK